MSPIRKIIEYDAERPENGAAKIVFLYSEHYFYLNLYKFLGYTGL